MVGRRGADAEPGGEPGIGVSHPQRVRKQRLVADGQAPPPGADRPAVAPQLLFEEAEGEAGHVDARRVEKHAKPVVEPVLWVENPPTRGFNMSSAQLRAPESGWKRLNAGLIRVPRAC